MTTNGITRFYVSPQINEAQTRVPVNLLRFRLKYIHNRYIGHLLFLVAAFKGGGDSYILSFKNVITFNSNEVG